TVTFNVNVGTFAEDETGLRTVESGKTTDFPANPVMENYTFIGWYDTEIPPLEWYEEAPKNGKFFANKPVTENITFYALWKVIPVDSYVVTFMQYEGGDIIHTGFVFVKDYYRWVGALPAVGTRAHYESDGSWWLDTVEGEQFTTSTVVQENITVYAVWQPLKYKVYFWRNGDSNLIYSTGILTYPIEEVVFPIIPRRSGYAFQGWYTEKRADLRHDLEHNDPVPTENRFTPQTQVESDVHLYALWKVVPPGAFTVQFLAYENYILEERAVLFEEAYKVTGAIPAVPARPHYYSTDGKWYTEDGIPLTNDRTLTGDVTVTPQWAGNTYNVRFMRDNVSTVVWETRTIQYPVHKLASLPISIPYREHYTTDGRWWTQKSGGQEFTTDTVITGDTDVYQHWAGNTYTVNFKGLSDTSDVPVDLTAARTVTYPLTTLDMPGVALPTVSEIPARTHYTFDGRWWTEPEGGAVWNAGTAITQNITLYAHWTAKTYTVRFDTNGGGQGTTSANITYPASTVPLPPKPSRAGHVFAGWNYQSNGNGRYFSGSGVSSSFTVYAKWMPEGSAGGILTNLDSTVNTTNNSMTQGGVYDDEYLIGSGVYSGPQTGAEIAAQLLVKLAEAAVLRKGTQQAQQVQIEGGYTTIFVTNYDYAAMNLVMQDIGDLMNDPRFVPGGFAPVEHTIHYSGAKKSLTVVNSGLYEIELWGASGGHIWSKNDLTALGGKGGYAKGRVYLNAGDVLKFYVGGEGSGTAVYTPGSGFSERLNYAAEGGGAAYHTGHKGGWNGGGSGGVSRNTETAGGSGGGGAADVRFVGNYFTNKNDAGTLAQRIIVAGGGGGAAQSAGQGNSWPGLPGGAAGQNGIRYGGNVSGGALAGSTAPFAGRDLSGTRTSGSIAGVGGNGAAGTDTAYEGTGGGGGGYHGGESISVLGSTAYTSSGAGGSSWVDTGRFGAGHSTGLNDSYGNGKAVIKHVQ
ncbi:MAG: InlB B-repeat-containing protein, partial [Spirochaetaceae bacterium]|nr:InlB B-repeat-containing protein [Spirochaetaceae bacterium]